MKLSLYVEKVKNIDKSQRPIGSNKASAGAQKIGKGQQQMQVAQTATVEGKQNNLKGNSLYQKFQNPKNKKFPWCSWIQLLQVRFWV